MSYPYFLFTTLSNLVYTFQYISVQSSVSFYAQISSSLSAFGWLKARGKHFISMTRSLKYLKYFGHGKWNPQNQDKRTVVFTKAFRNFKKCAGLFLLVYSSVSVLTFLLRILFFFFCCLNLDQNYPSVDFNIAHSLIILRMLGYWRQYMCRLVLNQASVYAQAKVRPEY